MHYEEEVMRILEAIKAFGRAGNREIPVVMAGGVYTGAEARQMAGYGT